jgi:hypothetical protein
MAAADLLTREVLLPEDTSASATADERMTADRQERKYLLEAASFARLQKLFATHLPRHFPPGALRLPGAQQFSTTVYFDTRSRHLFETARSADESVKLRAREYYTLDPSLVQLARRPEEMVRFDPVLWFELKHKQGSQLKKHRFAIPKEQVPVFLQDGRITPQMVELQSPRLSDASSLMLELAQLCQHYGEAFEVDCLVNYRRVAYQDSSGHLRLTLDRNIEFYAPPKDLWTRKAALIRETLGTPMGALKGSILEVKSRGPIPTWLQEELQAAEASHGFSKFVAASGAVHGHPS